MLRAPASKLSGSIGMKKREIIAVFR